MHLPAIFLNLFTLNATQKSSVLFHYFMTISSHLSSTNKYSYTVHDVLSKTLDQISTPFLGSVHLMAFQTSQAGQTTELQLHSEKKSRYWSGIEPGNATFLHPLWSTNARTSDRKIKPMPDPTEMLQTGKSTREEWGCRGKNQWTEKCSIPCGRAANSISYYGFILTQLLWKHKYKLA